MCLGQTLDLNTQFITNPIPNTPVWTDISSGVPGTSISNNFTPITFRDIHTKKYNSSYCKLPFRR